ncbi:MAG: DUF72 domain-containing protein [Patescibacteria group bacterium]
MSSKKYIIGTSGWNYPHWKGVFYPEDIPRKKWFAYFAERFNTVEVNYSFYSWPKAETLQRWRENSPSGFKFTMKAPRLITHLKKLKETEEYVKNFYELTSHLKEKCGAQLFQLPPSYTLTENNWNKLEKFLQSLDGRKDNVVEFRSPAWWREDVYELLKENKVGFCIVNGLDMPQDTPITGKVAYFRFHGDNYGGNYSSEKLKEYAEIMKKMECEKIYAYFNNDIGGHAVFNAQELMKKIYNGYT